MKVKRYTVKLNTTIKDLLKCGAKEDKDVLYFDKYVEVKNSDIRIHLIFTQNLNEWNDIDGVSVMDTDAGQLYKPFYRCRDDGEEPTSEAVIGMIGEYNAFLDALPFLKAKR